MAEFLTLLSIIRQEKKYLTPPFIQTIPNNLEIERGNPKGFYLSSFPINSESTTYGRKNQKETLLYLQSTLSS